MLLKYFYFLSNIFCLFQSSGQLREIAWLKILMKTPLEGTVEYFGHSYSSGKLYLLIFFFFFGCEHILLFISFYKWETALKMPWDLAVGGKERWKQCFYWCCALQNKKWKKAEYCHLSSWAATKIYLLGKYLRDATAIFLVVEGCSNLCPLLREKLIFTAKVKILKLDLAVRSQKRNLVFDGFLLLNYECCSTEKWAKSSASRRAVRTRQGMLCCGHWVFCAETVNASHGSIIQLGYREK